MSFTDQCPSLYLDEEQELLSRCTREQGHLGIHVSDVHLYGGLGHMWSDHEAARDNQCGDPAPHIGHSWGFLGGDPRACPGVPGLQVRGTHAPDALAGWSPAAQDSIDAAARLGIAETVQPPTPPPAPTSPRWDAVERSGAHERRAVLVARERQQAYAAGVAAERADAEQRVFHWAASLTKEHDRLVAAKAAEVIRAGR